MRGAILKSFLSTIHENLIAFTHAQTRNNNLSRLIYKCATYLCSFSSLTYKNSSLLLPASHIEKIPTWIDTCNKYQTHCTWRYYSNLLEYIPHRLFSIIYRYQKILTIIVFLMITRARRGFWVECEIQPRKLPFSKWASTICDIRLNFDECYLSSSSNIIRCHVRTILIEFF